MTTQTDLANRALLSIGARTQVGSVVPSDGSEEGNAISVLWQPTFEQLGRTSQWGCLRNQIILSLLAAAQGTPENPNGTTLPLPPFPWLYVYQLPPDCLRTWWIVPSFPISTESGAGTQTTFNNPAPTWLPGSEAIPYQLSYWPDPMTGAPLQVILTNQDIAQLVYAKNQPNPQTWDSLFQQAFVSALAAYLVPALSLSLSLMQMQIKLCEQAIALSRAIDGNEGTTVMDHLPDWMRARAGGGGYGYYGNCFTNNVFESMIWPNNGNL